MDLRCKYMLNTITVNTLQFIYTWEILSDGLYRINIFV